MNSRPLATRSEQPRALPGFSAIKRYYDASQQVWTAKILPGECYVTMSDEAVVTVLGSCISACIRDPVAGVGGMNHFMLPENESGEGDHSTWSLASSAMRYGNHAMEFLINAIQKAGGRRERFEAKIFGGARFLGDAQLVGDGNTAFVRRYLQTEGVTIVAHDTGGEQARKLCYYPQSGRVRLKRLAALHRDTLARRETAYHQALRKPPAAGDVTLF